MAHADDRMDPVCGLTSGDVARVTGVDLKTIHRWVKMGHLYGRRTDGGHLRFHRTAVVRFMHTFGYRVPESIGVPVPRIVAVGLPPVNGFRASMKNFKLETCGGLFDAALAVASGEHDALLVALHRYSQPEIGELIDAIRRCEATHGMAVIGVGGTKRARQAFIDRGGDAVVTDESQLRGIVKWAVGAGTLPEDVRTGIVAQQW